MDSVKGLNKLAEEIHAGNVKKGFWVEGVDRNVGELLMLIVSEAAEAMEAHRIDKFADIAGYTYNMGLIAEDIEGKEIESEELFKSSFKEYIKDSFEDEIADTIIRLLDLSAGMNIDIEKHIALKLKFNSTRAAKHGKNY